MANVGNFYRQFTHNAYVTNMSDMGKWVVIIQQLGQQSDELSLGD